MSDWNKTLEESVEKVGCWWTTFIVILGICITIPFVMAFWGGLAFVIATGTNWALGYIAIPVKQAVLFGAVVMPFVAIALRSLFSSNK